MKKLFILLLLPFLAANIFVSGNLKYEILTETTNVVNGVTHQFISASLTNDAGTVTPQRIHVLKADDTIETTVWSFRDNTGVLKNKNVIDIAKDFEAKNPNYEVVAAVNGDYFTTNQTINANMLFGSRMVNPNIHDKYYSLALTKYGNHIETYKKLTTEKQYAYFYDAKTDALYGAVELSQVNTQISTPGKTGYYYRYNSANDVVREHYVFDIVEKSIIGTFSSFYTNEGTKVNQKIENSDTKIAIVTTDEAVKSILAKGVKVKIQPKIKDVEEGNTILGVDSQILENGTIKTFEAIGGQSYENTSVRHPRTGIGFDENNRPVLFTVDGRQTGTSNGINLREFALIMKSHGVVNGFNLDGGGSTQTVIKENGQFKMVNVPTENPYRVVANAVLFIKAKDSSRVEETITETSINLTLPSSNYDVFVNGIEKSYQGNVVTIEKNDYIHQSISVVNKTTKSTIYTKLIYASKEKEPTEPTFTVSHEVDKNKLKIKINFTEADLDIDRMYVINQVNEENKVALVQYKGLRMATFDSVPENETEFIIYYELSNGKKGEISYTYKTDLPIVEEEDEDEGKKESSNIGLSIGIGSGILVVLAALTVIVIKRKK
ncbi:phosphodiester glycosidase family protein [Acholeplasma hippikon]|uniref:Exopolysaccharide biosynthesis protein related to N-acetylglucosamine-1-phosphodiester alpha-N-acetylglucosaminidase n=1 Tax=Acholeplasma hippikon TaxID=264636 RepID=A0A449BIC3_9MOLU|nr:phosphodiester glycosidase family protein [Acholeplasma hippikon]VEU82190.1 Exopolysaccharide biosynthesis protein related to N-acetylglucosamine-1-phosphodiester alpha-N-acetylglucosaminidase [Acholeplasma hippikon]